jgi:peptidoglycan/xylan/chitin deacetylase (PgdA/CDA1 family)
MTWLRRIETALDVLPAPVDVFFRDDDAGWDDDALYALLDLFDDHGLPVDVAVIPRALGAGLARNLLDRGVALHQHGYAHVSHERTGRSCEFGASRPLADARADIVAGRALLDELLGDALLPIFTPPWNRCSAAAGSALQRLGLVLSRDRGALPLDVPGLVELPIDVDWHGKRRGVPLTREQVADCLVDALQGRGPIGILFHHAAMDDGDWRDGDQLLRLIARHPASRAVSMSQLLAGVPRCG